MKLSLTLAAAIVISGITTLSLHAGDKAYKCPSTKAKMAATMAAKKSSNGPDIVDTAISAGSFKTLVAAVKAAGLVDALKTDSKLTVFAPTDEAFAKLPKGTVENLLKPENKAQLVNILTYHVVKGEVEFRDAVGIDEAVALNEQSLAVSLKNGGLYLNDAKVINNDIKTSNGIIHVIDTVLLPPESVEQASAAESIIYSAIDRGVPLYNHGNAAACADIYELAAEALIVMNSEQVSDKARAVLTAGLKKAEKTHDGESRAWAMRHALDKAMTLLN